MNLATIEEAIRAIAAGEMVILVDDEDRENEGDLVVAGSLVTAEHINFMSKHGRGLICLALSPERADALQLSPMALKNSAPLGTAFTVSIDHVTDGGVGAEARAATTRAAVSSDTTPKDFVTPGHVMPLRARPGGVLVRSGQTEGSVDLARLSGLPAAGVICEVMSADGTMARLPSLLEFGAEHGIPVVTVADLIRYRLRHERLVKLKASASLPTEYGDFDVRCYQTDVNNEVHIALVHGDLDGARPPLVRVHRADMVSDVLGLDVNPSRSLLHWALQRIAEEGAGVLLYLRTDAQLEQLDESVRVLSERARTGGQRQGSGGTGEEFYDFGIGAQILKDLGLSKIRVASRSQKTFKGLSGYDLEIVDWVQIEGESDEK